jgi:pyruvate dehydrogenase E1 component beta subunit
VDILVPIGKAKTVKAGEDITILATSKMVIEAEGAAKLLEKDGISAEVIDLRSLRPLDLDAIKTSIAKTHHAVVVNEGWTFGGYSAELSATIMDHCFDDLDAPVERVAMPDMPVPYSEPLELAVLPDAAKIVTASHKALS